jgi:hypothetical protein
MPASKIDEFEGDRFENTFGETGKIMLPSRFNLKQRKVSSALCLLLFTPASPLQYAHVIAPIN